MNHLLRYFLESHLVRPYHLSNSLTTGIYFQRPVSMWEFPSNLQSFLKYPEQF
jgi:hypothetical protein